MKTITLLITFFFSSYLIGQDLALEAFALNLDKPVNIKHAGDSRLFVAEQDGTIKIITADGTVLTTPFLDIENRVRSSGNEQGLLGLAFHPNYSSNGYFFVNYINNSGNTVISRFSRHATNVNLADPNSELMILNIDQPYSNHNGGDLAFGPDGYLYIASGDGGSGGDPQNNSQNLGSLLGKILRIDVNNSSISTPYEIPINNPFLNNNNANNEIWAYGLRNPWKFSFDRLNGDLWIADVGQNNIEEINRVSSTSSGLNYGWRCYEGNATFNTSGCPNSNTLTFPEMQYAHNDGLFKCSVTGGYRYRGTTYPNFEGRYFFADYCSGEIGIATLNNTTWNYSLEQFSGNWVAFGEAENGELYIASLGGSIYKIKDALLSHSLPSITEANIFPNPANTTLNIITKQALDNIDIAIFDMYGKCVLKKIKSNTKHTVLDVSLLNTGFYLLKIKTSAQEVYTKKLVIDKT